MVKANLGKDGVQVIKGFLELIGAPRSSREVSRQEAEVTILGSELGLGELCSKTLLCYAPMLSNALIMLLRIVIMLTVCSLYNIIHEHVGTWW